MQSRRVGVVMGGASAEREVSLASGQAVLRALAAAGHEVVPVVLGAGADALDTLSRARIDVAFLALHGRFGEDGCIQGVLEWLRIPYTGSSVAASALAMDKLKSKELFRLHNVPTPPYYTFEARDGAADLEETHGSFGFPVIVKPRREGSSLGVSRAGNLPELALAVERARAYDTSVLVERHIAGREVHVGILGDRVLGAIEVVPRNGNGIYDYACKYTAGMTEYHLPARLGTARYRGILNLAERAALALEVDGAVRVDLIVTEGQNEYTLEINTLPGLTPTSLLPKIAAAAGFDFTSLCEAILERARLHNPALESKTADVVPFPALTELAEEETEEYAGAALVPATGRQGLRAQRMRTR
jgi:D-alanine-D-alanine ligase